MWPPHLPLWQERRWLGELLSSSPSSSAAFGDHLPVPLLLLHQPGGEQGGGLRDPPKRDLPKPQGGDNSLAVADFSELHEPLLGRPELVQALLVAGIAAVGALVAGDLAGELAGTVPELLDGRVEVLLIFLLLQNKRVRLVGWAGHPKELVPLVPGFPSRLGHLPWR